MSDPAPKRSSARPRLHKLAEGAIPQDELDTIDDVVEVDAEAYLRWLESGEGPEPCKSAVSR
jgi:hypothetical protein